MDKRSREILEEEQEFKRNLQNNSNDYIEDVTEVGEITIPDENGEIKAEKLYIVKRYTLNSDSKGNLTGKSSYNYYLGDKCIGGFLDPDEPIFNESVSEKKLDAAKRLIEATNTDLLKEKSFKNLKEEEIKEIAETLGIEVEKIEEMQEMDLKQNVDLNEEEVVLEGDVANNLDIKEETNLNQYIKGETLEEKLGLRKAGIEDGVRLARVSTSSISSVDGVSKSTIDSFVVICKSGQKIVLGEDILKPNPQAGLNPVEGSTTIDNNGSVDKEVNTTSYLIVNGNGKEYLNVGYDENSGKEIKYAMWSQERGEYLNTELETNRTWIQDDDVREFMEQKGNGIYEAEQMLDKNDEHGECEKKEVQDLDQDPTNDSHEHIVEEISENDYIPNTTYTWRDFANKCGYRGEGDIELAFKTFQKQKKGEPDKTNEKLVNEIIEEKEEEYREIREQ